MVRLLKVDLVTVGTTPATGPAPEIHTFWPQGFVYTGYCWTVLQAVLLQEFGETPAATELIEDLRVWWSFRENINEDLASALGFFDLFLGIQPNWAIPTAAAQRPAMRARLAYSRGARSRKTGHFD